MRRRLASIDDSEILGLRTPHPLNEETMYVKEIWRYPVKSMAGSAWMPPIFQSTASTATGSFK